MYQSPFRIIDADALPQAPEALRRALSLEKKKLLAEFELAGSATITVQGQELHRQEVISMFDELGNETRLCYHRAVWQDAALLRFLEEGKMNAGEAWGSSEVYEEAGFLPFLSPHFAAASNAFMQRAITGKAGPEELRALHHAKAFLLPGDTEDAYRYVTRFFTEKKNELFSIRYRADNGATVAIGEITQWCTDDQVHLLNRLPDAFAALRYMLANLLNNICVAYDRKKAARHALAAIERAATIRVEDDELKQLIPANLRIIRNKQSRSWYNIDPETGKKKPKIGMIIVLFIVIIRIAAMGDSCNRSSQTHISNLSITPSAQEQSFTALLKTLVRPDPVTSSDTLYKDDQYALIRPIAAGDNPFRDVFKNDFNDTLQATLFRVDTSSIYVANQSDWQAIIIYQSGEREYGAAYVPPHQSYRITYYTHDFALQLYAGRDWSDTILHAYTHYATPYQPARRIIRGGFSVPAINSIIDTTGTPMYRRKTEEGHAAADTLTLSNSMDDMVQIAYDLGGE